MNQQFKPQEQSNFIENHDFPKEALCYFDEHGVWPKWYHLSEELLHSLQRGAKVLKETIAQFEAGNTELPSDMVDWEGYHFWLSEFDAGTPYVSPAKKLINAFISTFTEPYGYDETNQ